MVSQTEALLWTDSRYFIQAQQELGEGWGLKKMLPEEKKWFEYISEKYPKSSRVGFDPTLLTASKIQPYLRGRNRKIKTIQ
jgi:Xaa-Pro aminopeptidase